MAPVVLCGKTEQISTLVIDALKPEYEVIHFILDPAAGSVQIPLLLKGDKENIPSGSDLGTKNYSEPPVAVILSGGYDDDGVEEMMTAASTAVGKPVPWLRPDLSKPTPPVGPEQVPVLVQRTKDTLKELKEAGKMDEAKVVMY